MSGLLIVALLVISLWGVVFFRQFGLLGGCLAVLLVGSCLGHPFYHVNMGPLPITADRLLLGIVLVAFVLFRVHGRTARNSIDRIDLMLFAFIGLLVVSTMTHDWRAEGFRGLASLLFFHLMPLALYLVAREVPQTSRTLVVIMATFAAFGLYLAVTSVLEQRQIWSLVFPRYIVSLEHPEFLGRGRGPFLNPVGNGMFLCAGLFSLTMFWPRVGRGGKAVLFLLVLVYMAGVYCTLTRVVWLAAVAGLLAIFVLNMPRRVSVAVLVVTALLGTSLIATKWESLNAFKRDRYVSVAEMSQSASLRPILAYIAYQMYLDRPLVGCGYRQYEAVSVYYLSDRSTPLQLERGRRFVQHNVFLVLLAEMGMVGLGVFLLLLAVLAQSSWRLWRASSADLAARQFGLMVFLMLCSYVAMSMFHDLQLIPMVHMLLFFLAGVTRSLQPALATQPAVEPSNSQANTTLSAEHALSGA